MNKNIMLGFIINNESEAFTLIEKFNFTGRHGNVVLMNVSTNVLKKTRKAKFGSTGGRQTVEKFLFFLRFFVDISGSRRRITGLFGLKQPAKYFFGIGGRISAKLPFRQESNAYPRPFRLPENGTTVVIRQLNASDKRRLSFRHSGDG